MGLAVESVETCRTSCLSGQGRAKAEERRDGRTFGGRSDGEGIRGGTDERTQQGIPSCLRSDTLGLPSKEEKRVLPFHAQQPLVKIESRLSPRCPLQDRNGKRWTKSLYKRRTVVIDTQIYYIFSSWCLEIEISYCLLSRVKCNYRRLSYVHEERIHEF